MQLFFFSLSLQVRKYAFSGGRASVEEHKTLGGDTEVDVAYQYLSVFLMDDEKLKHIHDEYKSGRMLSGEIKEKLIELLLPLIAEHQKARVSVGDDLVEEFMRVRPLAFKRGIS